MKILNAAAQEFVPGGSSSAFASKAGKQATTLTIPIQAEIGNFKTNLLTVTVEHPQSFTESGLPTPNGLAELATCLSDNMTFEDLFDNSSRQNSLVGQLSAAGEAPEPEADHDEFHDAEGDSDSASTHSDGSNNPRSSPVAIVAQRKTAAEAAGEAHQQQEEAAAVARAQRELDAACVQAVAVTDKTQPKLGPQDFEILKVVGQGAFGKVFQVRARSSGRIFAMKVMRKERILQKDHGDYVRAERDVLTAVVHPYIVTLRYSFQTASKLYLVLDFINGGHLFFNLYRQGVFDEDVARLYTAEIVAALAYLHSRGTAHRDLKPENVLLDSDGHIRLTDFGLAKGNMDKDSRTNSFIGTMEYMAPEIIEGKGHGCAVDWWSTGILLYEMLAGQPPFRNKSRQQLQQQITSGKPKFPKFLSSNALNLLKGLLQRDPAQRLGAAGADAVKKHPFFRSINWDKLEKRQIPSKFKPGVKCSMSVENFDKIWTEQRPFDSPCSTPTDPSAALAFEGFTYIAPSFIHSSLANLQQAKEVAAVAAAQCADYVQRCSKSVDECSGCSIVH